MIATADATQRRAARVAGGLYLFAMATALLGEALARGPLIGGSAAETAANIMAQETLFRIGAATYLVFLASNLVLIVALYVVLLPVNRQLALGAALLRLIEITIGVVVVLTNFETLRFLGGAPYLQEFSSDQLQAFATLPLAVYHDKMNASLLFLGLGSGVFAYLWYKARYIPRVLAGLGLVAAVSLVATAFTTIVAPGLLSILAPGYFIPHFLFEVTIGFLLLFRGLR